MSKATRTNGCTLTSDTALSRPLVTSSDRSRKRALTEARREQNRMNQRAFRQKQRQQRIDGEHRCHSTTAKKLRLQPRPVEHGVTDTPITLKPAHVLDSVLQISPSKSEPEPVLDERSNSDIASTQPLNPSPPQNSFSNASHPLLDVDTPSGLLSIQSPDEPLFSRAEPNVIDTPFSFELPYSAPLEDLNLAELGGVEEYPRTLDILNLHCLNSIGEEWPSTHETLQSLPETGKDVPLDDVFVHSYGQVQALNGQSFDLEHVIAAGLEALLCGRRSGNGSQDTLPESQLSPRLPNPRIHRIQFCPNKIIMACIQNAISMGFLLQDVIMPKCFDPSPFYTAITPDDDPKVLLAAVTKSTTPVNLRPTLPQLLYPHPAFMDLIPMPVFRARAITLAATQPQLFDLTELKRDMVVEDGLVLWSPAGSISSSGSNWRREGQGQPWDMRSWEAAPWFLRKWRILVDGEDGEVWKQSLWWQRMRGDVEGGASTG